MGIRKSLLVIDLPYNTYKNKSEALKNSKKAIKDTKCDAVKIEGGVRVKNIVRHLVKNKILVLGHIGITPQTEKGKLKIEKLPLKSNLGKIIICTSKPNESKKKSIKEITSMLKKETISLIFGCDIKHNKNIRNLIKSASFHLDISNKGIRLSLDTELGAITTMIKNLK